MGGLFDETTTMRAPVWSDQAQMYVWPEESLAFAL